MTKTLTKILIWALITFIMALMLSCGAMLSHGRTTERHNGLGVVIADSNPDTSLVGSIVAGGYIHDTDGRVATVVRIHPKTMYALFDEAIAFCGDQRIQSVTSEYDSRIRTGNLVFTYRRQAARLIDGVPCFELRSVDTLVEKRTP